MLNAALVQGDRVPALTQGIGIEHTLSCAQGKFSLMGRETSAGP